MGSPDEACKCCRVVAVAVAVVVSIVQMPLIIFRCREVRGDNVPRAPQKKKWLVPIKQEESSPGEEVCVKHFPSHYFGDRGEYNNNNNTSKSSTVSTAVPTRD